MRRLAFWVFIAAVVIFAVIIVINIGALLLGPGFDPYMAGTRRANRKKGQTDGPIDAPWFKKNRRRQRKRDKIAKASRRANR